MKTLAIANKKGGVAKTTLACLVAQYVASLGHRVLALDLDEQGNLTSTITKSGKATVSATAADKVLTDAAATVENAPFVIMPASLELQALESQPEQRSAFARNLRGFLKRVGGDFDFAIIDTNPSTDIRVLAALVACDFVLSPFQPNQESVDGLAKLFNHPQTGIATVKAKYNPGLQFLGMLPAMLENSAYHRANMERVMAAKAYRDQLLKLADGSVAFIPRRTIVQEAQGSGDRLWEVKGARKAMAEAAWKEIQPVIHRVAKLMGAVQ